MTRHFDALAALMFLDGELAPEEALGVAAHAEACAQCSGLLGQLERESRWLREKLTEPEASPAGASAGWPARAWVWGAAAAAAACMAAMAWALAPVAQLAVHGAGGADLLNAAVFEGLFWRRWGTLLGGLQVPALAALAALALAMLTLGGRRRHWRVAAGALVLGALLVAPAPAHAARTFHGDDYTLAAGQTLHNDLFVGGDTVRIDGTVDGDVVAWARELTINGKVEGNVIAFTDYLNVSGSVTGDVATFANIVTITGGVGRELYGFVHHVHVAASGSLGALTLSAQSLDLEGTVARDVEAGTGSADVSGSIGGNADFHGAPPRLAATARVGGRMFVHSDRPPTIAPGAVVTGGWRYVAQHPVAAWRRLAFYWHQVLLWAAAFLVGWLLLAILPGFVRRSVHGLGGDAGGVGRSCGVGIAVLVATPVVAVLLAITLIGLPLGIILAGVYAAAIYLAEVMVGLWIGRGILGDVPLTATHAWPALALGLVAERVALNMPYHIGLVAGFAIAIAGVGAQAQGLYRGWRREFPVATVTTVHV